MVRKEEHTSAHLEVVGAAVRTRRFHLELDQSQLADLSGVSRRTIINIENGRGVPNERTQLLLERALGWVTGSMKRAYTTGQAPVVAGTTLENTPPMPGGLPYTPRLYALIHHPHLSEAAREALIERLVDDHQQYLEAKVAEAAGRHGINLNDLDAQGEQDLHTK